MSLSPSENGENGLPPREHPQVRRSAQGTGAVGVVDGLPAIGTVGINPEVVPVGLERTGDNGGYEASESRPPVVFDGHGDGLPVVQYHGHRHAVAEILAIGYYLSLVPCLSSIERAAHGYLLFAR